MTCVGKTRSARMWVYVADRANPCNVFDFTLNRERNGPKYFLQDYQQILLADAYGGYNGVVAGNPITRAGCWSHALRKVIDVEKVAPEIAQEAVALIRSRCRGEAGQDVSVEERLTMRQAQSGPVPKEVPEILVAIGACGTG